MSVLIVFDSFQKTPLDVCEVNQHLENSEKLIKYLNKNIHVNTF